MDNDVNKLFWVSLSNGDFNDKRHGQVDVLDCLEFELGAGGQRFIIVTDKPLTFEAYSKLQDFLSDKSNYERIVKAI